MARSIKCPHCGRLLKITDDLINKKITCAACKKKINLVSGPPVPKGPPPVPASGRPWHLYVHGRNVGPYAPDTVRDQLKAGKIDADTLAWKEGMAEWQPVGEIPELREAPSLGKRGDKAAGKAHERPHHYVPGKGRRDVVLGAWIAAGLAVVLLVVILVLMQKREEPQGGAKSKGGVVITTPPPETPTPSPELTPSPPTPGPTKKTSPKSTVPKPRLTNAQFLAALGQELGEDFKNAIEAHKAGKPKPIYLVSRACDRWASDLGRRDWEAYQPQVDKLVERLRAAAVGIEKDLAERAVGWDLGDGVDLKERAESLRLNEYQWIERWHNIIKEELDQIRKKGLDF